VFFGDFLQLTPVKGNQPFLPVTYREAKQRLGAVGTLEIWPQIIYDELTVNDRQRNDTEYADLTYRQADSSSAFRSTQKMP